MLDWGNYSDLNQEVHVTAWIRRFVNNKRAKQKCTGAFSAKEITEAGLNWVQETQNQNVPDEISQLR